MRTHVHARTHIGYADVLTYNTVILMLEPKL